MPASFDFLCKLGTASEVLVEPGYMLGSVFIALAVLDVIFRRLIDSFIGLPMTFLSGVGWPTARWAMKHGRRLLSTARVARVSMFLFLGALCLTLTWIGRD